MTGLKLHSAEFTLGEFRRLARELVTTRTQDDLPKEILWRQLDLLLQHGLQLTAAELVVNSELKLLPEQLMRARDLVERFLRAEPVAYLLGTHEFFGYEFVVTPAVLIPRMETEILVEAVCRTIKVEAHPVVLIDIGVGSGAILLSVVLNHKQNVLDDESVPDLRLCVGADISAAAVEVAKINARRFSIAEQVRLVVSDLLQPIDLNRLRGTADFNDCRMIITANLPYIDPAAALPLSVRDFEPPSALYAPRQGLGLIEALIEQSAGQMREGDRLFLEVGVEQFAQVESRLLSSGVRRVGVYLDHQGIKRVVKAEY